MRLNLERLKEIRKDNDYTQIEIARILGITQVQYSRYETGERLIPITLLIKLADYYNVSVDYLLGLTDIRKPYPKSILI
jgi:transcriptional regulator with XRE-family HTH domain